MNRTSKYDLFLIVNNQREKIFDNDWKPIHTATRRVSAIHAKKHLYREGFNILNLFIIYIFLL